MKILIFVTFCPGDSEFLLDYHLETVSNHWLPQAWLPNPAYYPKMNNVFLEIEID